jgi:hypothetical protein
MGFSEPEQVTQLKSKQPIEGFVYNPLFAAVLGRSFPSS